MKEELKCFGIPDGELSVVKDGTNWMLEWFAAKLTT